jgi:tetratricopeptide (TPR) repeat protein
MKMGAKINTGADDSGPKAEAPDPVLSFFHQGVRRMGQGRFEAAAACFERAIRIQPDFSAARRALGLALVGLGTHEKAAGRVRAAAACFERAAEVDPESAGAWNNLGVIRLEQGDAPGAVDLFRRAVDLDSQFTEAYTNLALALERCGDPDAAAVAVAQFVAARPDQVQGWRHLGLLRFHRGDLAGAAEALWKGLSIDPGMDDIDRILLILLQAGIHDGQCRDTAAATWTARLRQLVPASPWPALLDYGIRSLKPETATAAWRSAARRLEETRTVVRTGERRAGSDPGPVRSAVLLNFGRSGTGFLHSLIDGHPQVATMPGIYMKDFFSPGVWEAVTEPDPAAMAENFCALYEVLFDARIARNVPGNNDPAHFPIGVSEGFSRMGEDGTESLELDRNRFRRYLTDRLKQEAEIDAGRFFVHVHAAFEQTLGRPPAPDLLFYHIHNPNHFTFIDYLRRFPESRILMMVRHPLQSLESWVSKVMNGPGAYPEMVNRVVRMLFALDRPEYSLFPAAGLRLEDLKEDPDTTLRRLCDFFGIDMAPSLKRSTMQGLRWWGDPGSVRLKKKDPFAKMDDDPTARKVGSIFSETDQRVLETLFYPFSRRFGYTPEDPEGFAANLKTIRPLLDEPFDFEKCYAAAFPQEMVPLRQNHFCIYLRRLLVIRWETLMAAKAYQGLLNPV